MLDAPHLDATRLRALSRAALAAALLLLPAAVSAQSSQTPPSTAPANEQLTMRALQREALRLTFIARLPAADQAQASALFDRADTLRTTERSLRQQELQAYVDALKAGTAPTEARTQAEQKVAADRSSLETALTTLRGDVQSLVKEVPQARLMLRLLAPELRRGAAAGPNMGLNMGQNMGLNMGLNMGPQTGRGSWSWHGNGRLGYTRQGLGAGIRGAGYGDRAYGHKQRAQ